MPDVEIDQISHPSVDCLTVAWPIWKKNRKPRFALNKHDKLYELLARDLLALWDVHACKSLEYNVISLSCLPCLAGNLIVECCLVLQAIPVAMPHSHIFLNLSHIFRAQGMRREIFQNCHGWILQDFSNSFFESLIWVGQVQRWSSFWHTKLMVCWLFLFSAMEFVPFHNTQNIPNYHTHISFRIAAPSTTKSIAILNVNMAKIRLKNSMSPCMLHVVVEITEEDTSIFSVLSNIQWKRKRLAS